MSLRLKSLLIFSAAMIVLFGIVLLLAEMVINREFAAIEIHKIAQSAEPVANAELTSSLPLDVQAGRTIRIFLISLASSAGILLFVVWYLLDSNVIYPVQRLAAQLAEASAKGRLPSDLGFPGSDELAMLARRIEDLAKALAHTENSYRRLFETATDGILIVRQSSRTIADANPELCRLLDCERHALVELPVNSVPPFKKTKTLRALSKLLDGSQPLQETEITLLRGNGDQRFLEVRASIYDAGGNTIVQLNFRDISKRKQANNELRQLSGHLLRSQDEERRRIARELHDSTAQELSALQLAATNLEAAIPASNVRAREILNEIRTLTDLSVKEIRTISYLLHPPLLDEVGLPFALRWYVDGFMSRTETIVHLDVHDSLERLPSEIETTIFRVVQEGLTNIHRHSDSRRAWIRVTLENGVLTVEIRDEGRGMKTEPIGPSAPGYPVVGVGIAGMRERLRQFNGSLAIESGRKGTTLRATLPLESDESQED